MYDSTRYTILPASFGVIHNLAQNMRSLWILLTALAVAKAWDTNPFAGWPSCAVSEHYLLSVAPLITMSIG